MLYGPRRMRSALVDLRRKLLDGDQYAMCHCLELLDFIMKNCSSEVHEEVLSAEFLAVVKTVVTVGCLREGESCVGWWECQLMDSHHAID